MKVNADHLFLFPASRNGFKHKIAELCNLWFVFLASARNRHCHVAL